MADEPKNDQDSQDGPDELLRQIMELLKKRGTSVPDHFTREDVLKEVIRMLGGKPDKESDESADAQVASKARSVLGLPDSADADAVALALSLRGNQSTEVVTLRAEKMERDIDARLEVYIDKNVINPNNAEQVASARRLCASDPNLFESIMATASPYAAPGVTTATRSGTTGRATAIRSAMREWNGDEGLQKQTSQQAYCNLALMDSTLDCLTDAELTSFSIKVAD